MKKSAGLLLLAVFSVIGTVTMLHGCGGTQEAAAPAPAQAKFTVYGSGN